MITCRWCLVSCQEPRRKEVRERWNVLMTLHRRCEKQKQIFDSVELPKVQNPRVFTGLGNKHNPLGVKIKIREKSN